MGGDLVDVVFVHGLNGDPHNTWTGPKSKTFWPAQLLPRFVLEEKARILTYGYAAEITSFTDGRSSNISLVSHAQQLIAELVDNRRIRKAGERPLIFVAHSLGGLLVKRALIYSADSSGVRTKHLRSIFVSTYGILFLGTPHPGSSVAEWGSALERLCRAVLPRNLIDTQPQLVDALRKDNEFLQDTDRQFLPLMSWFHLYYFHEGRPTNLKGTPQYIVNETSASPMVPDVERAFIDTDHSHMCKFESDSAPGFDLVVEGIQRYAGDAPSTIAQGWMELHDSLEDDTSPWFPGPTPDLVDNELASADSLSVTRHISQTDLTQAPLSPTSLAPSTSLTSVISCKACSLVFAGHPQDARTNLQRHLQTSPRHNRNGGLRCPHPKCRTRPSMRADNLVLHLKKKHKMSPQEVQLAVQESRLPA